MRLALLFMKNDIFHENDHNQKVVTASSLARVVEQLDTTGKMVKGQQLVARAWFDQDFKRRQVLGI